MTAWASAANSCPRFSIPFSPPSALAAAPVWGSAFAWAILREHNGQIQAQSPSDGGAVFTVSVPIAKGTELFLTESSAPASHAETTPPPPSARLAGCMVLVVDDEEGIRDLVRDGLTARRMRVDVAASAEEALAMIESHHYQAVLCDFEPGGQRRKYPHRQGPSQEDYASSNGGAPNAPGAPKPFFMFMTGELVAGAEAEALAGTGTRTLQKAFPYFRISRHPNRRPGRRPFAHPITPRHN